jgi:hypothetical protein
MTSKAKIFLLASDRDHLIPMQERPYRLEEDLHSLLARYPDLIPGDQINPEQPRRWLLVSREMPIPDQEDVSGRWSLDHLFLDQDGIPTFVECKRASDTRGRREVVAQMLDYAANGLAYWNIQRLRQEAAETAQDQGEELDAQVAKLIDRKDEEGLEAYWAQVEANLNQGRIRLIFVADAIPRELRRLVEFLNDKLIDIEVLAVEIKQFQGQDHTVLVPRVLGITEATRSKKTQENRLPNLKSLDEFLGLCPEESRPFLSHVFEIGQKRGHKVRLARQTASLRVALTDGGYATFIQCWIDGRFTLYLGELPFTPDQLNDFREKYLRYPVFRLSGQKTLAADVTHENQEQLNAILDEIFYDVEQFVQSANIPEASEA